MAPANVARCVMRRATTNHFELAECGEPLWHRNEIIWDKALPFALRCCKQLCPRTLGQQWGEEAKHLAGAWNAMATDILIDQAFELVVPHAPSITWKGERG
jgi:hypothetical protein